MKYFHLICWYGTMIGILLLWIHLHFECTGIIRNGIATEAEVLHSSIGTSASALKNATTTVKYEIDNIEYTERMDWILCDKGDMIEILYMPEDPEQPYTEKSLREKLEVYDMVSLFALLFLGALTVWIHI